MSIAVTELQIAKKVSGQGLSISWIASDFTAINGAVLYSADSIHEDDLGRLLQSQPPRVVNSYTPLNPVMKRDSSSPKNATDLSMMLSEQECFDGPQSYWLYPYAVYTELLHIRGDERGNTVSDQKMRGGIAG